eukprot:1695541-Prymnesium_polylepis.1
MRSWYSSSSLAFCVATVSDTHLVGVPVPQLSFWPSREGDLVDLAVLRTGCGGVGRVLAGDLDGGIRPVHTGLLKPL